MNKVFAILILATHLFNVCGYRLFFLFAENKADQHMVARLDANKFDDKELLEIKVALHTPYIQNSGNYERYDGEIVYNNVTYNYVKRMIYDDTLYLYCIPNTEGTRIMKTKDLVTRANAGNSADKTTQQAILKKINLTNNYDLTSYDFNLDAKDYFLGHTSKINTPEVLKGFSTELLQPPDLDI
ncbi:MAG: hypothetical protein KGM98_06315 [Bacteroidota bacterium]|nr:hypothetical protein [Bacteroidota bacterium]